MIIRLLSQYFEQLILLLTIRQVEELVEKNYRDEEREGL